VAHHEEGGSVEEKASIAETPPPIAATPKIEAPIAAANAQSDMARPEIARTVAASLDSSPAREAPRPVAAGPAAQGAVSRPASPMARPGAPAGAPRPSYGDRPPSRAPGDGNDRSYGSGPSRYPSYF
jgi:hypothetical protein